MNTLDIKTKIYLHITGVKEEKAKVYSCNETKSNVIYVFNNYDEYKNYFLEYIPIIEEDVIDMAIYTRGKNGEIIAFKGLCDHIIKRLKSNQEKTILTLENK